MAIAPLFVVDRTTLLTQLRMTGAVGDDKDSVIDKATQAARIRFYDTLDVARVNSLLAIGSVDNPTTANEVSRVKANQCEVLMVRQWLMRELPMLFMDAAGSTNEDWNEDSITRSIDNTRIETELAAIETQIVTWLGDLTGEETPDGGNMHVFTPESRVFRPGASLGL